MKIYNYSSTTFEFLNESDAYLNPVATKREHKEVYMLPAYATFDEPPQTSEHQIQVWLTDKWVIKDDYRGMYKVNETMNPELITSIGTLDEGYAAITPEQADVICNDPLYYIYDNGAIIENPNYDIEKFEIAKEQKLQEALIGAKNYIETKACFQFDDNNSIEATDGNIGKLTAYALGFNAGMFEEVQWTSKEDNVLTLNQEQLMYILTGLGAIQSEVWNIKYVGYKQAIDNAETIEDIERIEIDYD